MAFGGVLTGSMKPYEAPKIAARAGIRGSTPAALAMGITIGTTIPTLAVLEVVSEMSIATTVASSVMPSRLVRPRALVTPLPMVLASPVSESNLPRVMPAPKSRMVPQSMRTASFQVMVKRRSAQLIGRIKRSAAARIATTPSFRWSFKKVAGEDSEGDREPEGDKGVALARGEPAEAAALLSDVLIRARDPTHLRAVKDDQDYAEGHEHQDTDRERRYGPLEKGDGLSRLVLDKADPDEVRRAADRRYKTAHRCTVGDHEHHGGAEAETAGVPLALGLVGDQTSQSGHHAEPYREEHRGGGGVRDEGADRHGNGAEGNDN